jgi:hypothetical protein
MDTRLGGGQANVADGSLLVALPGPRGHMQGRGGRFAMSVDCCQQELLDLALPPTAPTSLSDLNSDSFYT